MEGNVNSTEPTTEDKAKEDELLLELESFNREKDRLKTILGQVGGKPFSRRDNIINISFLVIILGLFIVEMTTHIFPTNISIELGVLMVSIKIVFMIHGQHKVNHFQFWILNSIEFRMNDLAKKIKKMEKNIEKMIPPGDEG
ncbi:MAG: hypothetical protein JEY99_19200 [Spirochaetales bacterium]|nr:hypothetical protein [Spirochaetales bacterium]